MRHPILPSLIESPAGEKETPPDASLNHHFKPVMTIPRLTEWVRDEIKDIKRQYINRRTAALVARINTAFFLRRRHKNPLALAGFLSPAYGSSVRYDVVPFWVNGLRRDFNKDYHAFLAPFFDFQPYNNGYSRDAGETKGYALKAATLSHVKELWEDTTAAVPINAATGQVIGPASLPSNGVMSTSRSRLYVPALVPFARAQVDAIIATQETDLATRFAGGAKRLVALRHLYLVRQWVAHTGGVPNLYSDFNDRKQQHTARLMAVGDCNLQRLPKRARELLYAGSGWWDYDFVRCHPTILRWMCIGLEIPFLELGQYLDHRDRIDGALATKMRVPVTKMKSVINAMIYGQTLSLNANNPLVQSLGRFAVRSLVADKFYLSLYGRMKGVRKEIIERHTLGQEVTNALGQSVPIEYHDPVTGRKRRTRKRRLMAHIIQGVEATMLNAVCGDRRDVLVLMHDGFVSEVERDMEKMKAEIRKRMREQLGYDVVIDVRGTKK